MSAIAHQPLPGRAESRVPQATTSSLSAVLAILVLWVTIPLLAGSHSPVSAGASGFSGNAYPVRSIEVQRGPQLLGGLVQRPCGPGAEPGARCWVAR